MANYIYDKTVLENFIKYQDQLFDEPVAETIEEADEFLDMMMAVVVDSRRDVIDYFEDQGFYTAAGIIPSEKYFCSLNIDSILDEARISKEDAVRNQRVDFIVTRNHAYDWNGYELVNTMNYTGKDFNYNIGTDTYYLYKRAGL